MKIRIIKRYILSEEEAKLVKQCLDYCSHRLIKHEFSGIQKVVSPVALDLLRKELIWHPTNNCEK